MDINTATNAGNLAAAINGYTTIIAEFQAAITGGYVLAGSVTVNTPSANGVILSFPSAANMTAPESATLFNAAIAVYQARLTAAQNQLTGM